MKTLGFHILRVGMGITFLWIGILIFREPESWGGLLQPWVAGILPVPVAQVMIGTAILDIVIGFLLLINVWTWVATLIGSIHLMIVLATTGINEITVRDIGLLAGVLALMASSKPPSSLLRFMKWNSTSL